VATAVLQLYKSRIKPSRLTIWLVGYITLRNWVSLLTQDFIKLDSLVHNASPGTISEGLNGWSEALMAGLAVLNS